MKPLSSHLGKPVESAIEREPKNISPYIFGASLFEGAKDVVQAEIWYRMALDVDPQSESALRALARMLTDAGRKSEALAIYKRLIDIRPEDATYHTLLGNVYLESGLIGKALATYEKADELAKHTEGWIIANIGNLMTNRGLYPKAVNFLKEAVSLEPESAYAHERLAAALRAAEEEDEKEKELLATLKPKPLTEGGS